MQSSKTTGCWQHLALCLLLVTLCMNSCRANNKFDDDIYEIKGEYTRKPVFISSILQKLFVIIVAPIFINIIHANPAA